jgi:hypothetical protein
MKSKYAHGFNRLWQWQKFVFCEIMHFPMCSLLVSRICIMGGNLTVDFRIKMFFGMLHTCFDRWGIVFHNLLYKILPESAVCVLSFCTTKFISCLVLLQFHSFLLMCLLLLWVFVLVLRKKYTRIMTQEGENLLCSVDYYQQGE